MKRLAEKIEALENEIGKCSEVEKLKMLSLCLEKEEAKMFFLNTLDELKRKNLKSIQLSILRESIIKITKKENYDSIGYAIGIIETGNLYDSNYTMYQASKGHGFAGEKINHLYDRATGKQAQIIGLDNAKNGADRLVDGIEIQTKFCATGRRCIAECFDNNGNFKYIDFKGNPMKIEVPKDKYDEAIRVLEEKIKVGKVPKVSNPKQAKEIIKKSPFTYEQAKNVAKFGTVESIIYDAIEGVKTVGVSIGISAALSFACSIWDGEEPMEALKKSCQVGVMVGGISWVSTIAAKQLARTSLQSTIRMGSDAIVKQMGPKVAAKIVNTSRSLTGSASIYGGAAMKSCSKLMSGNIVTGIAMTAILSTADIYRMFQGRASGKQVAKTIVKSGTKIAGGTTGMIAGAAVGAKIGGTLGTVVPGFGNIIGASTGGFIGGVVGSIAGDSTAEKIVDVVLQEWLEIKDDIEDMLKIFHEEFSYLAFDYLITSKEIEKISKEIKEKLDVYDEMRNMYQSKNREKYAKNIIVPFIEKTLRARVRIKLPNESKIFKHLEALSI